MSVTSRHPRLKGDASTPTALPNRRLRRPTLRELGELPQQTRTVAIVALSLGSGAALATLYPVLGLSPLLYALLAFGWVVALVGLSHRWVSHPIEHLARQLKVLTTTEQPVRLRDLPTQRGDELGVIARAVADATDAAARHAGDAQQLRRTLDHRISKETQKACAHLQIETLKDPLTGLGNRRLLDERLPKLLDEAIARHQNLTCVMIDMDRFKQVNDTLGHAAGDQLLCLVAELLQSQVRPSDLAVRIGGDEFCVVLPDAGPKRATELCEQVRSLFNQRSRSLFPNGPHADVSFGTACLGGHPTADAPGLLHAADQSLYANKKSRR